MRGKERGCVAATSRRTHEGRKGLWMLAQSGDGARALARFNVRRRTARGMPGPLAVRALKRRKRRAPSRALAPTKRRAERCHASGKCEVGELPG